MEDGFDSRRRYKEKSKTFDLTLFYIHFGTDVNVHLSLLNYHFPIVDNIYTLLWCHKANACNGIDDLLLIR